MAVKYVKDFSFPSDFGFHKSVNTSKGNAAQGVKGFNKTMVGPSVVTGNTRGTGGGKLQHGAVAKFSKGGLAKGSGVGKGGNEDRGIGKTDEHFQRVNDKKSPPATRKEVSSGVQRPAFKKGGHAYAKGGSTLHESGCKCNYCSGGRAMKEGGSIKVAAGKVKDGQKTPWNKDDGTSPGSFKRTPPGEKETNKKAAYSKFDAEGRDTEPATKQSGNVERMSEFSDFKRGGKVHKKAKGGHATTPQRYAKGGQVTTQDRYETGSKGQHTAAPDKQVKGDGMEYAHGGAVHPKLKNLKHYAHPKGGHKAGGDVKVPGTHKEVASGHAGSKQVNTSPGGQNAEYERDAGTPGVSTPGGDNYEMESGEAYSMGGLSRGTSPKKNAAMHAKMDHKAMGQLAGVVGALSQPPRQPAAPGMGPAPPGMAPQMGAPPGMAGGVGRGPPPMAGGQPGMADGGSVVHVVHHHVNHG